MIRFITGVVCLVLASTSLGAANKEQDRLEGAGVVLEEVLAIDDNIPQDLLDRAQCVIVIPSMLKVAVGIGGSYGRGAMVCRTGLGYDGPWGAPAMYALDGGSFGLQLGGQATDLVLLVMNSRGRQCPPEQQGQARGQRLRRRGTKRPRRQRLDRRDLASRNSELLPIARAVCRRVARRRLAASRQRRQRAGLWTTHHRAHDRHRRGDHRAGGRPSIGRCPDKECAAQHFTESHQLMTTTSIGSSLLATRLLILTLAGVAAGGCGTSASDATDTSLTAENGKASGILDAARLS